MVRPPRCTRLKVKKGIWTNEKDDAKIPACVSKHGTQHLTEVSKKAGLRKYGQSCRLQWTNQLRPDLKHESFTPEEEELIIRLHAAIGSRWSIIAQQLPGRTDSEVKNYWNTRLRKKLIEMGIDPVTHKPFSQILADYGNIGGLPRARTQIGSLNRDLKNALMFKSEQSQIQPQGLPKFNNHLTSLIIPPKTEPAQDSLLSNNMYTNHQSLDLLAQLQSIILVTEASNCINHETAQPQFLSEGSCSSSTSPSSPSSIANQVRSPLSFSWRDFLLEDAFLEDNTQEQEGLVEISTKGSSSHKQYEMQTNVMHTEEKQNLEAAQEEEFNTQNNSLEASSSSKSSFVEVMLDQENDTFLGFPGLLEEPFYY